MKESNKGKAGAWYEVSSSDTSEIGGGLGQNAASAGKTC